MEKGLPFLKVTHILLPPFFFLLAPHFSPFSSSLPCLIFLSSSRSCIHPNVRLFLLPFQSEIQEQIPVRSVPLEKKGWVGGGGGGGGRQRGKRFITFLGGISIKMKAAPYIYIYIFFFHNQPNPFTKRKSEEEKNGKPNSIKRTG